MAKKRVAAAKPKKDDPPQVSDSKGQDGEIKNWANKPESEAYKAAEKFYTLISKAYANKQEQADQIEEFWNIYKAKPDENQQYSGNSQCYIPAVRDAVKARSKRRLKQLFPMPNRHVDAVGADGETPFPQMAILEHYIRKAKLKDIVRSDLVAGDVTGQWNLYIDWLKTRRTITKAIKRNPTLEDAKGDALELEAIGEEEDDIEDEEVVTEGPDVYDFATEDLAVIPPTCTDIEKAEVVAIRLRMSKAMVRRQIDEGVFTMPEGQEFDDFWKTLEASSTNQPDGSTHKKPPDKQRTGDAGIRTEGTYKYMLVYEATALLDFEDGKDGDENKRLGYIYYAGPNEILGIIKAPQWGGKRPILSAPVERVQGSFFGESLIEPVKFTQWNLNDFWNMGQDSAFYSMLPIMMSDPVKNPQWQTMVMGLAAVWACDPNSTKALTFPQLWKEAAQICDAMKRQIWESLDVNEMMMGKMPQGRKNNQMMGQMQNEQMTGITDDASRYEECMLNPLLERMFEYDAQFRTEETDVMVMGEVGVRATIQSIPVQQWGVRYHFQWAGTEIVNSMQRMQQQIAWMNVLNGTPPDKLNGLTLDIAPIIRLCTQNIFGAELTPKILIDNRSKYTVSPEIENEMLVNQIPVIVHPADEDEQHIMAHQQAAKLTGDMSGVFRKHLTDHMTQLQKKREAAAPKPAGGPGVPGGAPPPGAAPGVAGAPRPGAQPQPPKGPQQPPGAVHPDAMMGAPGRG